MNFLIGLIPAPLRLWALGLAIAAALGFVAWQVHMQRDIGRAEVRLEWDAQVSQQREDARIESEKNRQIEAERTRLAAQAQQRKDDALHAINTRLAADLVQLRNRPERPAGGAAPGNPPVGQACTGAQLYRPDAEFLAGEAARAQRVLEQRDYCHQRYESLSAPR
jgi:hypothetical protein